VRKELLCGCYSAFNIYSAKKISVRWWIQLSSLVPSVLIVSSRQFV
jgi:hypothetical protein